MNTTTDLKIKCPHCGNRFEQGSLIEHEVQARLDQALEEKLDTHSKSLEQRIKKEQEEKYQVRLELLEQERDAKAARLAEWEESEVSFEEREQKLKAREAQIDLELRKKMLQKEKVMRKEIEQDAQAKAEVLMKEKQRELQRQRESLDITVKNAIHEETEKAREEERMKTAQLQKKLDDTTALINTMKRKAEQGSMQAQGEVQELAIEEYLRLTFPRDIVEEIAKGKRGGDCLHLVHDALGNTVGKILYESKRTRAFGADWTQKLRDDLRICSADLGVIVTETLPGGMTRFGLHDGLWVCTFAEFKALCFLLRDSLLRIGEARTVNENRGEKMQLLYEYLTSNEFCQKIGGIVEAFQSLQEDLAKEKKLMNAQWAKRDKQIHKVIENTVSLYGDVRGIAGASIKQVESLEMDGIQVLIEE